MTNHPVHLQTKDENDRVNLSPTAMIPFCGFGGNMSVMGVKIDQFDVPVCNSFRPKVYKDQLCYTVDPNRFKDKIDLGGQLSLTLAIDYNEDRMYNFSLENNKETNQELDNFDNIQKDFSNSIIIETIGNRYWQH